MTPLHPLRFEPILQRYLWGGRRLGEKLGKPIGDEPNYAESWEIVDRDDEQSRVAVGPLAGSTIGQLVRERGQELLGRHHPQPRFPLLIKYLDAAQQLSVQVHPDDQRAQNLNPPDRGKTEAWVVLEADPGSKIFAGLTADAVWAEFDAAVRNGRCEPYLHTFEPKVGDCVFLPAGTVHALGAGLLVAEVQQNSNVTYRLFDFNRVGPDGKQRALHINEGLAAISWPQLPIEPRQPHRLMEPGVERLVACSHFVLDRWTTESPGLIPMRDACHVLMLLEGALAVQGDAAPEPLRRGGTVLLPASLGEVEFFPQGRSQFLVVSLP
ncbi:MAG: type I phosphomannose isomerase catalytic subunit [Planctomycetota bacterium]